MPRDYRSFDKKPGDQWGKPRNLSREFPENEPYVPKNLKKRLAGFQGGDSSWYDTNTGDRLHRPGSQNPNK